MRCPPTLLTPCRIVQPDWPPIFSRYTLLERQPTAQYHHHRTLNDLSWSAHRVVDCADGSDFIALGRCIIYIQAYDDLTHQPLIGPSWLPEADPQNPKALNISIDGRRPDPSRLPALKIAGTAPRLDRYSRDDDDALAAIRYCYADPSLGMAHVVAARSLRPFGAVLALWTRVAAMRRVFLGGQPSAEPLRWPLLDDFADALEATGTARGQAAAKLARRLACDPDERVKRWYPIDGKAKRLRSTHPTSAQDCPDGGADASADNSKRARHSY